MGNKEMKRIFLSEKQIKYINENVYVKNLDKKKKKANLTYTKGGMRNLQSKNSQDFLKTDKMDQNNSDTYEVKLKNNLICYNITSIRGNEVMHYFKRLWDYKPTTMKFKNTETNQDEEYELTMLKNEETEFIETFKHKVGIVVRYCVNKFKEVNPDFEINGISIYPVPSSSNFNVTMAKILNQQGLYQLPVQVINENLFLKDLKNLERDEEFIKKNQDLFNSPFYLNNVNDKSTIDMHLNKNINKFKGIRDAQEKIAEINNVVKKLLIQLANYHAKLKSGETNINRMLNSMVENYKTYYDLINELTKISTYYNPVTDRESKTMFDFIAKALKYSKGPSIEKRSAELWSIVKKYVRGIKSPITNEPYQMIELAYYDPVPFQIKNLTNAERMGLKNIYSFNSNEDAREMVLNELNKIKGTVFVIFDDNISGGATLSDICYQCEKIGIKNIIPITFGEMNEKWTLNMQPLTSPTIENGHSKWNF